MNTHKNIQERIPKTVYQLAIQSKSKQGLELARAVLLSLGYTQGDLVGSCLKGKSAIELFDCTQAKLDGIEKLFHRLSLAGIKIYKRRLVPKDWLTLW